MKQQSTNDYTYDVPGNMLSMPHLSSMGYDYLDQLHTATNGTFTSYYNYDAEGNRTRKVVEKGNITETRYYINGYEVYKKEINNTLDFERKTLNISDDEKVFVRVEQKTGENEIIRYQYDNHLGSACLELDTAGQIISYEEYLPFGTTSYRSGRTETEVSLKRYKYNGKERDEETGLYMYGMRYYAAWICRFINVDPLQFEYPYYTPYQYAGNKPITFIDLDGAEEVKLNDDGTLQLDATFYVTPEIEKCVNILDLQNFLNYNLNKNKEKLYSGTDFIPFDFSFNVEASFDFRPNVETIAPQNFTTGHTPGYYIETTMKVHFNITIDTLGPDGRKEGINVIEMGSPDDDDFKLPEDRMTLETSGKYNPNTKTISLNPFFYDKQLEGYHGFKKEESKIVLNKESEFIYNTRTITWAGSEFDTIAHEIGHRLGLTHPVGVYPKEGLMSDDESRTPTKEEIKFIFSRTNPNVKFIDK